MTRFLIKPFRSQGGQVAPPLYPYHQGANNGAIPTKRYKPDELPGGRTNVPQHQQTPPPFYLSSQQLQVLQNLQKRRDSLSQHEQNMYKQLYGQYNMMVQHQQQLRLAQQQNIAQQAGREPQQQMMSPQQHLPPTNSVSQTGVPVETNTNYPVATGQAQQNAGMPCNAANVARQNSQMQQQIPTGQSAYTQISSTSLAENLLKQFSANIKEEVDEAGCGSSSPHNVAADSTTNATPQTIKCEATSTSTRPAVLMTDIKNEPILKIENIMDSSEKANFSMHMDAKEIVDAVK